MTEAVDRSLKWERSTFCADGACAEVAVSGNNVFVRNSRRPTEVTRLTLAEFAAFADGVRNNQFRD